MYIRMRMYNTFEKKKPYPIPNATIYIYFFFLPFRARQSNRNYVSSKLNFNEGRQEQIFERIKKNEKRPEREKERGGERKRSFQFIKTIDRT